MDRTGEAQDPKPKRTNSMAFASTDCHRCNEAGKGCDRSRPQCSTCLAQGLKCPGFVTPLSWDSRRMWLGRPSVGQTAALTKDVPQQTQPYTDPQAEAPTRPAKKFRFVDKPMSKRRRLSALTTETTSKVAKPVDLTSPSARLNSLTPIVEAPPRTSPVAFHEQVVASASGLASTTEAELPLSTSPVIPGLPSLPPHAPNLTSETCHLGLSWELSPPVASPHSVSTEIYGTGSSDDFDIIPDDPLTDFGAFSDIAKVGPGDNYGPTLDMLGTREIAAPELEHPATALNQTFLAPQTVAESQELSSVIPRLLESGHEVLLNMYDSELCVLPVTYDTNLNPFRCQKGTSRGSQLLFHAILALCYQHLNHTTSNWPKEANEHRNRATVELDLALTNAGGVAACLHLLDSILILFTLECTLSASGPWTHHLLRASAVLDAAGGVPALNQPRVRSQVGMLVWWDATLALISRQGLVMDPAYFQHLVKHEEQDGWLFYDLSGCPTELLKQLFNLAQLAAEEELAQTMQWLTFDKTPVLAIEKHLRELTIDDAFPLRVMPRKMHASHGSSHREFQDTGSVSTADVDDDDDCSDEEDVNFHSDTYHCIEAWRHALLTYTYRVFMLDRTNEPKSTPITRNSNESIPYSAPAHCSQQLWTKSSRQWNRRPEPSTSASHSRSPGSARRQKIQRLLRQSARKTLNHVRSVRRSSQTQKQLLLPIFLAASETSDPDMREFACEYCEWWAAKSRYQMFSSVPEVLTEIWAEMDADASRATWWGKVIDRKTRFSLGSPWMQQSGVHFLFG